MLYEMKNTETGEIFEICMKLSEYDDYLKNNPHVQRHHSKMVFIDSVMLGRTKPPKDFQEGVVERIKRSHKDHTIQSRWS